MPKSEKKKKKKKKRKRSRSSASEDEGHSSKPSSKLRRKAKEALALAEKRAGQDVITIDHYFEKQSEFRVWLYHVKHKCAQDVEKKVAQAYFKKFAKKWNAGALDQHYYTELDQALVETTPRTQHSWAHTRKMTHADRESIQRIKDRVDTHTNTTTLADSSIKGAFGTKLKRKRKKKGPAAGPSARRPASASDRQLLYEQEKSELRNKRKQFNRRQRDTMDELVPKKVGKEAMLEKKRAKGAYGRNATRDREDAKDGLARSDSFLMGGGSNSFSAVKDRMGRGRRRRDEERRARVSNLVAAERDKVNQMKAMFNLQPGKKYVIPKRKPGA